MLADVTLSVWTSRAFDPKASKQVADLNHVGQKMGNYNKNILPVNTKGEYSASYKAVTRAADNVRNTHYKHSLPWSDQGSRILPSANYFTYREAMQKAKAEFEVAAKAFCDEYPALKVAAKPLLNGLYDESNYPDDITGKFGITIHTFPLPAGQDFRATLPTPELNAIRKQIEKDVQERNKTAMDELWTRLYKAISSLTNRVQGASLLNLKELLEMLPVLNFTGDQKLNDLAKEIEKQIANELIDTPQARKDIAQKAADIQSQMAGIMGITK
jgi:hypothetical protein